MNSKPQFLCLLAAAFSFGCSSPSTLSLHSVENRMPPLKAGVHDVAAVDHRPVPISRSRLTYPAVLRANGVGGKAVVAFTVRADGSVADPIVLNADDIRFGEAATAAILKWRFRPALLNGTSVDCRMTVPISFSAPSRDRAGGAWPTDDPAGALYGRSQPVEPR